VLQRNQVIDFRILGPLEVVGDEGLLEVGGRRERSLLAFLLLRAGEVVSTERLVDQLWGEHPPPTATTSLQNAVSRLRKLLGPDLLVTRPPGYVLRLAPEQLDLSRFERLLRSARTADPPERAAQLREALALWRGAPLADLESADFAQAEIRRLEELRLVALEDRIDADLELGGHDELVGELESLVARHPLRERLRGQLMVALYRSGRQAEALQAFRDARRTLDELGIEPSPTLQQLHGAILRQERSLQPAGAKAPSADHFAEVLKALLSTRLVPVLGPEALLCGRPDDAVWESALPSFAPGLSDLASHLAREFGCPPEHIAVLSRVSQYVAVTQGIGPLYDMLHELFDRDYPPGPVHRLLASLPPLLQARGASYQLIVTTGYDELLERAFEEAGAPLDVVSYMAHGRDRGKFLHVAPDGSARVVEEPNNDTEISLERNTVLLKLYGGVDRRSAREQESFVVSEDDHIDYLAYAGVSAAVPITLAAKLRRSHFLFLGYGVDDWSLRVFLRRLWGEERVAYRSWAVQPNAEPLAIEYWRQRGVDVFEMELEEYVSELGRRLQEDVRDEVPA